MYVALAHLVPTATAAAPTAADAQLVQDALWAHAAPEHRLEHVRVRPEAGGIALTFFLNREVGGEDQAKRQSEDLLRRARNATVLSCFGVRGLFS